MTELKLIASPPVETNYIWVKDFTELSTVEKQLENDACNGTNTCFTQLYVRISTASAYFMVDTDVLSLTIESGVLYPPIISLHCDH